MPGGTLKTCGFSQPLFMSRLSTHFTDKAGIDCMGAKKNRSRKKREAGGGEKEEKKDIGCFRVEGLGFGCRV
jgi:hypothetical protein